MSWLEGFAQPDWHEFHSDSEVQVIAESAIALLKEQEAVVRCKDCEHCYFASNRIPSEQNYACGKHGFDVAPDWFCADGVAKDINVPNKEGR